MNKHRTNRLTTEEKLNEILSDNGFKPNQFNRELLKFEIEDCSNTNYKDEEIIDMSINHLRPKLEI